MRAILGVPGALRWSGPLPLPDDTALVYLAPGSRYAIVEREGGAGAAVMRLDGSRPAVTIPGSFPRADLVAFSPAGSAVALYSREAAGFQVVAGLPDAPAVVFEASAAEIGGVVGSLAVSDDAGALLAADDSGMVYLLRHGAALPLYGFPGVSAVVFAPDRLDAVVCDQGANEVWLLRHAGEGFTLHLIASANDGIDQPSAAAAGSDGESVFVASASVNRVWRVSWGSATVSAIDLPVKPTRLEVLRTKDTLLFSAVQNEASWLLIDQPDGPRNYAIPALPAVENAVSPEPADGDGVTAKSRGER